MAKRTKSNGNISTQHTKDVSGIPKSRALAERGTKSVHDFLARMDAVQADCIARRLTTTEVNAVANVAGKQLKMLDLAYKYGQLQRGKGDGFFAKTKLTLEA